MNKSLKFTRGDTFSFKFQRKDKDGEIIETISEKMWFTVKKNYNSTDTLIQKTLLNDIVFDDETKYYHVTIQSEDTRELNYGDYVYDIQIMNGEIVQTIAKGSLKLDTEVTTDYE